jgi:hypothetical protein
MMKRSCLLFAILTLGSQTVFGEPFKATATVKLENAAGQDEAALRDFLELAKKPRALEEITARLALTTAWELEPEAASARLASVLELSLRGKDGKITASDESPVMAAIIANTAACVLQEFEASRPAAHFEELDKTIAEQTGAVADKRKLLAQIIRQSAIVPQGSQTPTEDPSGAGYVNAKGDFESAETLLKQLKSKRAEAESESMLRVHHVIWAKAGEKR